MKLVPYVTGRRKALARAIALESTKAEGLSWANLTIKQKAERLRAADRLVARWIDGRVLATFLYEYRE